MPVYRGMTHDGLGKYLKQRITKAPGETDDIVGILKDTHTDVVVSYLRSALSRPPSGTWSRSSRPAAAS